MPPLPSLPRGCRCLPRRTATAAFLTHSLQTSPAPSDLHCHCCAAAAFLVGLPLPSMPCRRYLPCRVAAAAFLAARPPLPSSPRGRRCLPCSLRGEQQRLTVIPPVVTLVIAVLGGRRHGQQHGVMIRRTLQLPASSCRVGTGQEETSGPQHVRISTWRGSTCNEEEIPNRPCVWDQYCWSYTRFKNRWKLPWWGPSFKEKSRLTLGLYVWVVAWTFPTYVEGTFCTGVSLYWGVFNILKIMTTTHNDIVCISYNSKSAHSNPSIYINMQNEDSLSFPMVLGSGGCRPSLVNKICVGANGWDRDFYRVLMWFENWKEMPKVTHRGCLLLCITPPYRIISSVTFLMWQSKCPHFLIN